MSTTARLAALRPASRLLLAAARAYCADCRANDAPTKGGAYAVHRREAWTMRTRDSRTERCPSSGAPVPAAAVARWVAWELESARAQASTCATTLLVARRALDAAVQADADARERLAAIEAIAAARGITAT